MRSLVGLVALLGCSACRDAGCVELTKVTPVLEQAFPLGYGSINRPNGVLATLQPGPVRYVDSRVEKDHLALHVRLDDGRRGYIIWDSSMKECAP